MTNNVLNNESRADFTVYGESGGTRKVRIENTNNTASSNAISQIYVEGTSAGDPFCRHVIGTSHSYALGIDNSDSDKWKLTYSSDETATPSSSDVILSADTSGRWRRPMTPLFEAYVSSDYSMSNAEEAIRCNTEVFDQGSNYNTGTYTYTCPLTATYFFLVSVHMSGVNATNDWASIGMYSSLVGCFYVCLPFRPNAIKDVGNYICLNFSFIVRAAANDTFTPYTWMDDQETINQEYTRFSGYLLG